MMFDRLYATVSICKENVSFMCMYEGFDENIMKVINFVLIKEPLLAANSGGTHCEVIKQV